MSRGWEELPQPITRENGLLVMWSTTAGRRLSAQLPCLLLILALISPVPLSADSPEITNPEPAITAPEPPADTLTATEPSEEPRQLTPLPIELNAPDLLMQEDDALDQTSDEKTFGGKSSTFPKTLAMAGLLLIPFDSSLSKSIVGADVGMHSSRLTNTIDSLGTKEVLLGAIGGMYFLGDDYEKDTAKLALTALVNTGISVEAMKTLSGRSRPNAPTGAGEFSGPTMSDGHNSFPSGHTAAAFSVATVLANRQPKKKWLYYGLAAAVGLTRVRKSAHYASDVLVGAGLGIYQGNNALKRGPNLLSYKKRW